MVTILGTRSVTNAMKGANGVGHKVLTYIEYRAVPGVFQNIDPHPLLHPASVSSPRSKGGRYTLAGRWGGWGVNILEDASHRIGLLQSNLSAGGGGFGKILFAEYVFKCRLFSRLAGADFWLARALHEGGEPRGPGVRGGGGAGPARLYLLVPARPGAQLPGRPPAHRRHLARQQQLSYIKAFYQGTCAFMLFPKISVNRPNYCICFWE